jgi:hypothetical protein
MLIARYFQSLTGPFISTLTICCGLDMVLSAFHKAPVLTFNPHREVLRGQKLQLMMAFRDGAFGR